LQVTLLQHMLAARQQQQQQEAAAGQEPSLPTAAAAAAGVEVLTIDRCQGRDKEVVLMSFVRSSPSGAVGSLLMDWQRLNVALTRAKVKLVMVGSARTLAGGVPLLAHMISWVRSHGLLVELPADVLRQHSSSSSSSSSRSVSA
jgi:superfamily I DNA and/or RNA helicase